jgi:bifunctional DNA-binding transcriptional regulator/antitoxin component of YhaV-PrlF toxin-antitoxin module
MMRFLKFLHCRVKPDNQNKHQKHGGAVMQVRISAEGQLTIPAPLREQLGIGFGEAWVEIEVKQGILQAFIISQDHSRQETAESSPPRSRLQALRPHPEAVRNSDEDLDRVNTWDEAEWARKWDGL